MEKDICHWYIHKGLICKIHKELIQLNTKKQKQRQNNPNVQLKNGQRASIDTHARGQTYGQ